MLDAYLLLKNDSDQMVEGESADQGYERYIEIRDFSLGEKAMSSGSYQPPLVEESTDTSPVVGRIEDAVGDVRSQFLAELQKVSAANLERQQKREEIRRKTGQSLQTGMMQAKSLVMEELRKRVPDQGTETTGDRLTFKISKDVDAASADLFQAYCSTLRQPTPKVEYRRMGEFKSAEITLRKMFAGTPKPYLICLFSDVSISAYDLSYDSGRTHLVETVTFKFVRYKMRYQSQDRTGTAGALNPETSGSIGAKKTS